MTETTRAGWCGNCKRDDHSHHRAPLGGICVGCACPGELRSEVECGGCGGTGNISDLPGCPDCYGTGSVPR